MKEEVKQYYKKTLMERIDKERDLSDEELLRMIDELLLEGNRYKGKCTDERVPFYLTLADRRSLRQELFDNLRRLGIIQQLIEDDSVTEIMVNGLQGIFVEREGRLSRWEKNFESRERLEDTVQSIVAGCNRVANETTAIVDARLEDGARVNVVMAPVALEGPIITIRRFPNQPITMEKLIQWGSITREASEFLRQLVRGGYNIFISGGTGSGKTTFLNALSDYVPKDERIITIEDNAELQIRGVPNLVRLEARRANEEGENEITIRDLIKASLRMRPDRIIVGEVRGPEAIDMLMAIICICIRIYILCL